MGLTSRAFVVLMICAAGAALTGVTAAWPRAARRRAAAGLAARLGLLAGSQVVVIAAFLACLNAYFGFFGSWAELLGTGPPAAIAAAGPQAPGSAGATSRTGGSRTGGSGTGGSGAGGSGAGGAGRLTVSASQPGPLPGERLLADLQPAPDQAGRRASAGPSVSGKLLQVTMTGPRTGISVSGDYVYLPPQYFQKAYARARFPVILGLTGYPGSAKSLVMRLNLPSESAAVAGARRMPPAVLVMMNASPVMPRDTECTDVPAGPQVQTFFARDVPRLIEARFRVQAGPAGWSVLGYSTGGYCAVKLAMRSPYQFGSAVSLAGYYVALRDGTTGNLYGGSLGYRHENDPDWRLRHLPAPPVSVLVASSRVGEETYPGTLAFLRLVRPPMRAYSLFLPQGGHNFRTWQRELPQSLAWLGQRLTPPRPAR